MVKSHAISYQTRGNGVPRTAHELYRCHWKAGISRYLIITLYVTNSTIFLTVNETDHQSLKTYENTAENLKKAWAAKRGAVRNFKKKESRWTAPELEFETIKDGYWAWKCTQSTK